MRVIFKKDAASTPADFTFLDRIIHRIEDGAHEWCIEDPESLEASDWLRNSRPGFLELFKEAVKKASYPRQTFYLRSATVTVSPQSGELSPQQAARYVAKPLYVLMENRFTDGQLLDTALSVLSPEPLRRLRDNNVPDLIHYDSPGGNGELLKLIERYVSNAQSASLPLRIVVFTDSDSHLPGAISIKAKQIEETCKQNGIPCILLKKRAIENYIPDEILQFCDEENRQYVTALCKLTAIQRDHFPIKDGIKHFNSLPQDERNFYGEIDRKSLSKGLGNRVISLLKTHEAKLTTAILKKRDYNGELNNLAQMITNEL